MCNVEAISHNDCCLRRAKCITYTVCVCVCVCIASVIQRTQRMRYIILPSVPCLPVPYYSTHLINARFSGKKILSNINFVFLSASLSEIFLLLEEFSFMLSKILGPAVAQWLRSCATNGQYGSTVVKELWYKSEGRWFDPSWCHCNFLLT